MQKLLEHYESQYKLAKRLNVSRAYVCQWFAVGKVPPLMAIEIEKDTQGKFKAIDLVEGE